MIFDTLDHLKRYYGLHKNFDTVIDFILSHDLSVLPDGKTVIDGEEAFVNAMDADLRSQEDARFEFHAVYADLQVNVTGAECWAYSCKDPDASQLDSSADIGFMDEDVDASGQLGEERFALFLPNELHMPSLINGSCVKVRKLVFKIKM